MPVLEPARADTDSNSVLGAGCPLWDGVLMSLLLVRFIGVARDGDEVDALGEIHQPYTHRLPLGATNLRRAGADDDSVGRDRVNLVLWSDRDRTDKAAPCGHDTRGEHALAPSALNRIL